MRGWTFPCYVSCPVDSVIHCAGLRFSSHLPWVLTVGIVSWWRWGGVERKGGPGGGHGELFLPATGASCF